MLQRIHVREYVWILVLPERRSDKAAAVHAHLRDTDHVLRDTAHNVRCRVAVLRPRPEADGADAPVVQVDHLRHVVQRPGVRDRDLVGVDHERLVLDVGQFRRRRPASGDLQRAPRRVVLLVAQSFSCAIGIVLNRAVHLCLGRLLERRVPEIPASEGFARQRLHTSRLSRDHAVGRDRSNVIDEATHLDLADEAWGRPDLARLPLRQLPAAHA
mmetsp:Transcript_100068/g.283423  ORF Transcript_100068/g.283423 Transcript_100068/m.283423 type:complete len:214 (+) Transcript_100068:523-1164(+)